MRTEAEECIENCINCKGAFWKEDMVRMPHPEDKGDWMCDVCFEQLCNDAYNKAVQFLKDNTVKMR